MVLLNDLAKVSPTTGRLQVFSAGYREAMPQNRSLEISGARGTAFPVQIVLSRFPDSLPELSPKGLRCQLYYVWYHACADGFFPDALIPVADTTVLRNCRKQQPAIKGRSNYVFFMDLFPDFNSKEKTKTVSLKWGGETATIKLTCIGQLLDWTNVPAMDLNNYGLFPYTMAEARGWNRLSLKPADYLERMKAYYSAAAAHCGYLNVLPYKQSGYVFPVWAPVINDDGNRLKVDFSEWDRRFSPILSGSLFKASPGRPLPPAYFYLPLNITWPAHFSTLGTEEYRRVLSQYVMQWERHLRTKKWDRTVFHVYLNHKKRFGYFPFDYDEPNTSKDIEALRDWGEMVKATGVRRVLTRTDVWHINCTHKKESFIPVPDGESRRYNLTDQLDKAMDAYIIYQNHLERAQNHKGRKNKHMLAYCGAPRIDRPLLDGFLAPAEIAQRKADGLCFWCTNAYSDQDPFFGTLPKNLGADYLFYPAGDLGIKAHAPSLRLKAVRKGFYWLAKNLRGLKKHAPLLNSVRISDWDLMPFDADLGKMTLTLKKKDSIRQKLWHK